MGGNFRLYVEVFNERGEIVGIEHGDGSTPYRFRTTREAKQFLERQRLVTVAGWAIWYDRPDRRETVLVESYGSLAQEA